MDRTKIYITTFTLTQGILVVDDLESIGGGLYETRQVLARSGAKRVTTVKARDVFLNKDEAICRAKSMRSHQLMTLEVKVAKLRSPNVKITNLTNK